MTARRNIVPFFVPHRGCPNDCVFCNQRRISGSLTPVTANDVNEALNVHFQKSATKTPVELAFYGGSFTAIPYTEQEELLGAALPFLRDGRISAIRVSTRPDSIEPEILDMLRGYGVRTIELGAQSMLDEVLVRTQRGHTAQDVRKAAKLIKNRGFLLGLQMMTGLPGDCDAGALYTAREICALAPDMVRIYPTVIVRDTKLCDDWLAGKYREHTVEDAVRVCAEIVPLFQSSAIPIIRLGLNPTDDLSGGAAMGGAYHPALGELVYSRIMRSGIERLLAGVKPDAAAVIGVHKSRISQAVGQKRCNIDYLIGHYALKSLKFTEIDCGREEIRLISVAY